MINLEHDLTVDDLIVEYMIYKVKNGYEPQFSTSEFMSFLHFFTSKMPVKDSLYENEKLFKRFFKRKEVSDWSNIIDWDTYEKEFVPHMDMIYSEEEGDYIIKANYGLSDYDKSVINTYFMDNGMSKFDNFKGTASKIRNIIGEYLSNQPKRKIDETIDTDDTSLIVGKYFTAEIVRTIWDSYISKQIENHKWPKQCKDIDKYLFEIDLAEIIGLKSIKKELLDLYEVISKRIAILYQQDNNLRISNCNGEYLAKANYELLTSGYERMFEIAYGSYKSSLDIDLSEIKESHGFEDVDDEILDGKPMNFQKENDCVKKLVRVLDKVTQNN